MYYFQVTKQRFADSPGALVEAHLTDLHGWLQLIHKLAISMHLDHCVNSSVCMTMKYTHNGE